MSASKRRQLIPQADSPFSMMPQTRGLVSFFRPCKLRTISPDNFSCAVAPHLFVSSLSKPLVTICRVTPCDHNTPNSIPLTPALTTRLYGHTICLTLFSFAWLRNSDPVASRTNESGALWKPIHADRGLHSVCTLRCLRLIRRWSTPHGPNLLCGISYLNAIGGQIDMICGPGRQNTFS